jgi:putative MFS transporter
MSLWNQRRTALGITYQHPVAFWTGLFAVVVGTAIRLPMYFMARDMHYQLVHMKIDATMVVGMVIMCVGIVLTAYGVFPSLRERRTASTTRTGRST